MSARVHVAAAAPGILTVPGHGILQRRLRIGAQDDPFEREADRRAAEIVASPAASPGGVSLRATAPLVQQKCAGCEDEEEEKTTLQRAAVCPAPAVAPPAVSTALGQGAKPLPDAVRSRMEPGFAADFSTVRIHTDSAAARSAEAVHAHAYTVGEHIVFAEGAYVPESVSGRTLIAHELTHVLQQRAGEARLQRDAAAPAPAARPTTGTLDTAVEALRAASFVVPGLTPLLGTLDLLRSVIYFWEHRHEHMQRLLDTVGTTLQTIPGLARARLAELASAAGTAAEGVACVGDQLILLLESLAVNWRGVLESFIRDMFFVGLFERSIPRILDQAGLMFQDIFDGEFRSAADRGVTIMTEVNAILGVLFLWYALISTVVGAAAGTEVPVAGNAVGAAAGLTLAQVVNIGLIASVVATETARVARGFDDMSRFWDDIIAREQGCRHVAEGIFALALTGALFYFGPQIQSFARSIITRAAVGVRRALVAGAREATVLAESLTAPALVTPEGLAMPFAGPDPFTTPRPVTPARAPRPARPPVSDPVPPRTPAPAPRPGPAPPEPVVAPTEPVTAPAPAPAPRTAPRPATGAEPLPEDPLRRCDGLRRDCPLPFIWYKPIELYAPVVDMPNAVPPGALDRDAGPTPIGYRYRGRTVYETMGVANWPAVGRTFQFIPYSSRVTPEQARFNGVLDTVGFDRAGFDAEHVWDVYLRGLEFDRFTNLWPASNQEQQLAGTRHRNQILQYEARFGNVNGRWFRIVAFRHPA
jgi:hypothetical protein